MHLLAAWDDAEETYRGFTGTVNRPLKRPASVDWFFRAGLTYSHRSQIGFSIRALPSQTIFHDKGPGVFPSKADDLLPYLALLNSVTFGFLLNTQVSFGSYEVGALQRTPVPELDNCDNSRLSSLSRSCVDAKRSIASSDETTHVFHLPALLQQASCKLNQSYEGWSSNLADVDRTLDDNQRCIDDISFDLYGVNAADRMAIQDGMKLRYVGTAGSLETEDGDEPDAEGDRLTIRDLVADLISYFTGCILGRWDVRLATGDRLREPLPSPFDPLPVCSSGMLRGPDGLPVNSAPDTYPLRIDSDGIVPDDPDHSDDIGRRVREVLELIWKDRAEAIEKEACEILGVKELRDYFRKPAKGGFWDDHVARYSKSRRKAPIYWLLQSSKKNYALWLYYHRLDKDVLFKARQNYVEPKIRLEETRLGTLKTQKAGMGTDAKGARRLDKDIERQEALLGELADFAEKLERAAKLNFGDPEKLDSNVVYDPDLNDGVVLNIAPLWELVPWKEAKNYWEELLEGKYEWSSMGKLLRKKGLVSD